MFSIFLLAMGIIRRTLCPERLSEMGGLRPAAASNRVCEIGANNASLPLGIQKSQLGDRLVIDQFRL
jgi:hypothetical protein